MYGASEIWQNVVSVVGQIPTKESYHHWKLSQKSEIMILGNGSRERPDSYKCPDSDGQEKWTKLLAQEVIHMLVNTFGRGGKPLWFPEAEMRGPNRNIRPRAALGVRPSYCSGIGELLWNSVQTESEGYDECTSFTIGAL